MSDKIYIIDGSGYIFRAFYAVTRLTNKDGFPTNALYGFVKMLLKLIKEAESSQVVMVFDAGKKTFRNDLYPEYKANRDECPPELLQQMPFFSELTKALGVPVLQQVGYEADDLIATLAERLAKTHQEVVVVSGDKDLMQLVNDKVSVWDTMKDQRYHRAEVIQKFGVPPELVVEFLGLTGDTSDNIPGLNGVGPKTATQLIEKYKNVEGVLASSQAIRADSSIRNRQKIADQIESDTELIRLSRKLVEVCRTAPVIFEIDAEKKTMESLSDEQLVQALTRKLPATEQLNALVKKFDFESLIKDLNLSPVSHHADRKPDENYIIVYRPQFDSWLKQLQQESQFVFDIETTSLDVFKAKIIGVSFCWSETEAFYLPLAHKNVPAEQEQVDLDSFITALQPIFENEKIGKSGQNLKYDLSILASHGIEVRGVQFDTMLAAYLRNPDLRSYNLGVLSQDFLGRGMQDYEQLVPEGKDFSDIEVAAASRYSCADAHYTWLIKGKLDALIKAENLTEVFTKIEMPLLAVIARMELRGVKLDSALLRELAADFAIRLGKLEQQAYLLAGEKFNLNSTKQLAEILFNKLQIPIKGLKKTKTGISTDSGVLEIISQHHELPVVLLQYRMLHKLKSTYIDTLPEQVTAETGRLHSRFNQTGTATGRLSSSDPNLQNIPIQTAEGRKIREAFVAEPGNILISADYSQIELRVLAHMSGDRNMQQAFLDGADIHARTAGEILGLSSDQPVTSEQRRIGKTINFGVIYGMGGFRLAKELGIPVAVANQYIEGYFERFSGVREYFAALELSATEQGFVSTMFGRKRLLAGLDLSGRDHGFVQRVAVNAPIQGTAADIIKLAMIEIDRRLRQQEKQASMILQIHDELVFEVEQEFLQPAVELIRETMEKIVLLNVPLKVDVSSGRTWQEAHG